MAYAPDPGALQRSLLTAGLGLLSNRSPTDLHTAILNSLRSQQQQNVPFNALQLLGLHPGGFMQAPYTPATPATISPQNLYRSPMQIFPGMWQWFQQNPAFIDLYLRGGMQSPPIT